MLHFIQDVYKYEMKEFYGATDENVLRVPSALCAERWTRVDGSERSPEQKDGKACGFFTCEFAKYISFGWSISGESPKQSDMARIRRRVAYELLSGAFMTS